MSQADAGSNPSGGGGGSGGGSSGSLAGRTAGSERLYNAYAKIEMTAGKRDCSQTCSARGHPR